MNYPYYTKYYNDYFKLFLIISIMAEMSFVKIYETVKAKPAPGAVFVKQMAELTHRSEISVRKWLSGKTIPDINCQIILEQHFGVPRKTLFPILINDNSEDESGSSKC